VALIAIVSAGAAQAPSQTTDTILTKMDGVSRNFAGMEASIERVAFTYFADDESKEDGTIYFSRRSGETRIRVEITTPAPKSVLIDKGKAQIFNPKINQVQEYRLDQAKQRDLAEFLLIGFGQSSADIRKLYDPSIKGTEAIDGKKATLLELKPKAGTPAAAQITSIVLWLDQDRWVPIRTRIMMPNKDSNTVTYRNVKMGTPKASAFDLKMPKNVKVVPL
jgi:outer membrane lipoprotein-sorting protein